MYAMGRLGRCLEAYKAAGNKAAAFDGLAHALAESGAADRLEALIEAHRAGHPKDNWLPYYTGELHLLREEYEAADEAYAAGLALELSEEDREAYRLARVYARFRAGQALEAYEQIGPRRETFAQLAGLLSAEGKAEELAALVEAHRGHDADDPALAYWGAEALWQRGDYAAMVRLLRERREAYLEGGGERTEHEGLLVRGLARLGRHDEALAAARASTAIDGNPYYEAVAHAAAGRAAETLETLEALTQMGYDASAFYEDSDIGAALRGEGFEEVRQAYPPPADEPATRPAAATPPASAPATAPVGG